MNIVLTGSSTGIGRAIAERLLTRGHQVWGLARSNQAEFAAQHRGSFSASRCDVSRWAEVERAAADVASAWPHVDGLIACAGVQGEVGRALAADPARWSETIRANLDGTFYALRAFDSLLARAARRGKVVCFSGGGATKPRPRFSAYGVAKTGVVRLVETVAEEERGRPFDINAIAPGAINTRLTDEVLALGPAVVGEAEYQAALKTKSAALPMPSVGSAKEGSEALAKETTVPPAPLAKDRALPSEGLAKEGVPSVALAKDRAVPSVALAKEGVPSVSLEKVLDLVEWLLSPASDGITGRLIAAPWDPWPTLGAHAVELARTDIYTLRRIVPADRGKQF